MKQPVEGSLVEVDTDPIEDVPTEPDDLTESDDDNPEAAQPETEQ